MKKIEQKERVRNWIYFQFNYPHNFIQETWKDDPLLMKHLLTKFHNIYDSRGAAAVIGLFYTELDKGNQDKLEKWVENNYNHNGE